MGFTLRPYQEEAVRAVQKRFANGQRRVAGVAATGAGKTVILSALIREYRETDTRPVLVLAHRDELLRQASNKLRETMPGVRVGFIQGDKHHVRAPIIVASVQTLAPRNTNASRRRWETVPEFGMVVVDECHRSMSPEYQRTLEALGCLREDGPLTAGFTATFTREDKARLTDFWQSVAFSVDILDLIEWGFLVEPRFRRVLVEGLDLTTISTRRQDGSTDLASAELAAAMEAAGAAGVVAQAYVRHAGTRSGIVFTPSVSSAETVAEALRAAGVTAASLAGSTPKGERRRILDDYSAGRLQVVVNCAILGEGFDAPRTKCVVIARPTMSKILFRQQVGRGLRPAPETGYTDCLVLDLVGATGRNDLATLDDLTGTDRVHVREDETLTEAVKRAQAARAEVEGDTSVTGSLDSVGVDPWEAERRAKLTARERREEDAANAPQEETEAPEPPAARRRYVAVEHREGWLLRSPGGFWFVPLTTGERKQRGAVVLVPRQAGVLDVVAGLQGTGHQHVGTYPSVDDALTAALGVTFQLLTSGVERSMVDPDAAWRRRKSSASSRGMAARCVPWAEIPDDAYAGQVADWIALSTHGLLADRMVAEFDAPA